jgi:hypothetical protein
MRGEGEYAEQIRALFEVTCAKLGFSRERRKLSTAAWRGPRLDVAATASPAGQLSLF